MKRLFAKLALAASALMLGSAGANANVLVTIEQDGFGSGPIKVVSEDGKKWTKILEEDDLTLPVKIYLGITSGWLTYYEVKQVATTILHGGEWVHGTNALQENLVLKGSTKNFAIEALTITNACNTQLNVGNGIHEKHDLFHGVELELVGHFDMTNDEPYPPYSGYGTVAVPVECLPYLPASNDVSVSTGDKPNGTPLTIKEARVFLTTYSHGQKAGVTIGACPMLETTVRFETNKAGPVNFDLNRFPGGGVTNHTVNAAFDAGTGKYYARYQKHESFKSTTNLQYMAQSVEPLGGNTGWKDITIHCGGGLAPDTSSSDPHDGLPTPSQLKGDFSFLADNGTSCPRKGKALINFTTGVKDNVHYSLDCTNGHFSGVAQTAPSPKGGFVAPALVSFDITATTQANCVLKSVAPGAPKVHTLKDHKYQCVDRAVDPASNELTVKPKPKDSATPAGVISKKLEKAKEIVKDKSADDAKNKAKAEREAKAKAEREAKAKAEAERRRKAAEAADKLAKKLKLLKAKTSGSAASKETSAVIQSGTVGVR